MPAISNSVLRLIIIAPDDARLQYTDCAAVQVDAGKAYFGRPGPADGGFNYDSPGARIRFNCRAESCQAHFFYNGLHGLLDCCEGTGLVLIDGREVATFSGGTARPGDVTVTVQLPPDRLSHLCELVLPYGDSVDFLGLTVSDAELVEAPTSPRPAFCLVTYGDSITHGFWATDASATWPYRVGIINDWQVVNLGFAGRMAAAEDGLLVAAQAADAITMLIGVNDCLQGKAPNRYKGDVEGLLDTVRAALPLTPIHLITPLAVPGNAWQSQVTRLEEFRAALRGIVAERTTGHGTADSNLHLVEGESLIPADPGYFKDGLHPNDSGFALLAKNLAPLLLPG